MKYKLLIIIFLLLGILLSGFFTSSDEEINVVPLTKKWEQIIPHQEIPDGLNSISAVQCGICHPVHYEEWKQSTHAHAWTDMQFQAEIKKESSPYMCINCHIPLQNQQEYIVEGLEDGDIYKPIRKKNPRFDKALQQEGITCASCHVRDKAIIGTTGTSNAPHKTVKDSLFLSETLCISCHNAVATLAPDLVCTFETGDEWKNGPYKGKQNCISCHMETTHGPISIQSSSQERHFHYFAGSGIPKVDTLTTKMKNGFGIYPTLQSARYKLNDSILFSLRLKNEFAGHNVPTGDPERFFIIKFGLKDASGKEIVTKTERIGEKWEWYPISKKISDNNFEPQEERVYHFSPILSKKGKYVVTLEITKHRMDKKSADYNKLTDSYPLFISIFRKEYSLDVITK